LLSDPDKVAGGAYGVIQEDKPYPARITFLIDPEGKIEKVYNPVVPAEHPDEVLADLG
jgi:peroxiredoxin Q/BCP